MSNNFEHCHVHTTDFLSSKVKFIHTSTVTRSHSCYEKTTRTPRVHLVNKYYLKNTCKYHVLFGQVQVQVLWHFHTPSTQVHCTSSTDKYVLKYNYQVKVL